MNILSIISLVVGLGEEIVPIFVHNPKSQQVEAVIVSTIDGVVTALNKQQPAATKTAPAS